MHAVSAIAIASCAAMATAFVPPSNFAGQQLASVKYSTNMQMANIKSLVGGSPFGPDTFFDPLNLSGQCESDIELKRWQECEVKHGRVAMLAVVGSLVQETDFHPLFPVDYAIGPSIRHFQIIEREFSWFWALAVFAIGIFEADNIYRGWKKQDPYTKGISELKDDYTVGDLDFDPLNLSPKDSEGFVTMRTKEINNGRLAMIAIFGFWAQELVNYRGIIDNLFQGSPR